MILGKAMKEAALDIQQRKSSPDLGVRRQAQVDENELLECTYGLSEHPDVDGELYDGPCMCAECRSYGA